MSSTARHLEDFPVVQNMLFTCLIDWPNSIVVRIAVNCLNLNRLSAKIWKSHWLRS